MRRLVLTVLATFVFSLALAPAALAGATGNFGLDSVGGATNLGTQSFENTIAGVINVALSLLGVIALVIILYGGFKWMTAGGNEDGIAEAKKIIIAGVVGLAVILSAYAIAQFVLSNLATQTGARG